MHRQIRIDLVVRELELGPGGTGTVACTVRNASEQVQHLVLTMVGLPPGATSSSSPGVLKLLPSAVGESIVTVSLAAAPPVAAGEHVLGLLATSPHAADVSRCEEVRLRVAPAPALSVRVVPAVVTAGTTGTFTAEVVNEGNTTLPVVLTGSDEELQVGLEFRPASADLPPGGQLFSTVTARARRPWTGPPLRRSLTFAAAGSGASGQAAVAFVQRSRVPSALLRTTGAATGVGVLAAAVLGGTLLLRQRGGGTPGPTAPTAAAAVDSSGSPASSPTAPGSASPSPSGTPSPTAGTSPSVSPSPQASVSPSAGPSPSSTAASPSPTPVASVAPLTVALGTLPGTGDRLLVGSPLVAQGVRLAGRPRPGPCDAATATAAHGNGAATYVTAARPDDPTSCQDADLVVRFTVPVTEVQLTLVAPGSYLVETDGAGAPAVRTVGQDGLLVVTAPEGSTLPAVALARQPSASPAAQSVPPLGLRGIVLVPQP